MGQNGWLLKAAVAQAAVLAKLIPVVHGKIDGLADAEAV